MQTRDVYRPNGELEVTTAGENRDGQIAGLVRVGFDDESIARKTYPGDITRHTIYLTK